MQAIGIAVVVGISGLLWAAADPSPLADQQRRTPGGAIRVISYNVLEGFRNAPQRREGVIAWLALQRPDVVALQELNGYTEQQLLADARQWGHEYAVILKRDGYPTGLTSRTPITEVERVLEGYHHGTIHARTADVDFIVVHFSPLDYRVRRAEARQVADWVGRLTKGGREVIVLGDFNSMSPLDQENYEASGMLPQLRKVADQAGGNRNLLEGLPDVAPLQTLLDAQLVDIVARQHSPDRTSYPTTLIRKPEMDDATWKRGLKRIDYVLGTSALAARVAAGRVVNDDSMAMLSDHYPIVVDFHANQPAGADGDRPR